MSPERNGSSVHRLALAALVAASLALAAACSRSNQTSPADAGVTLIGCLQPGDARDTYRLETHGAPTKPTTGGVPQGSRPTNPTGTASKSRTADLGTFDTRLYTLVAGKNVDLAGAQGALVKVTGQIQQGSEATVTGLSGSGQNAPASTDMRSRSARDASSPAESRANPTTGQGPQSAVSGSAPNRPLQTIRVDKVQKVAPDCAAAR